MVFIYYLGGMKVNLDELVKDQIIDQETAERIQAYYKSEDQSSSASSMIRIVSIIGVVLIGLGLMLIIAYNWDSMAKSLRLVVALLPLGIAQALGAFTLWTSKDRTWKESSALSILFGIGIAMTLITQIYQMDGSLQDFLKWWILLSIPLLYIFDSGSTSLAVWIGIGWYLMAGSWNRETTTIILPLIFMMSSSIYYYFNGFTKDKTVTWYWHHWVIPIVGIIYLFSLGSSMCERLIPVYFLILALLFIHIGQRIDFMNQSWMNGYQIIGPLGIWIIAFILSFKFFWSTNENRPLIKCIEESSWILPCISCLVFISLLFYFFRRPSPSSSLKQPLFMGLSLILLSLTGHALGTMSQFFINLMLLVSIAWMIYHGVQTERFMHLNLGLLALAVWITCRFFETNISFAWRGVIFITLGVLCFSLNYLLIKRKKS